MSATTAPAPPALTRKQSTQTGVLYRGRKTSFPLHFIVVGGGLCGLACAFAMVKAGHKATVLEMEESTDKDNVGLSLPPHITKTFYQWGLGPELAASTVDTQGMSFHDYSSGSKIGEMLWVDEVMDAFGAYYTLITYPKLYSILYTAALSAGVTIRLGAEVTKINIDVSDPKPCSSPDPNSNSAQGRGETSSSSPSWSPNAVSAILKSGEIVRGDLIIGADGHESSIREFVRDRREIDHDDEEEEEEEGSSDEGEEADEHGRHGMAVYSAVFPAEILNEDPELKSLMHDEPTIWMGHHINAMGYPVSFNTQFALNIQCKDERMPEHFWLRSNCESSVTAGKILERIPDCEPRLRKLVSLDEYFLRTKFIERRFEPAWMDKNEKVVIVGHAAHPLPPCTTESIAVALEDCVVLGTLLSHLRKDNPDQLPVLMEAYQEIQQQRLRAVMAEQRKTRRAVWAKRGSETQRRRDARLKEFMEWRHKARERMNKLNSECQSAETAADPEVVMEQWELRKEIYGYDASEAADDWYAEFGFLQESATAHAHEEVVDLGQLISKVARVSVSEGSTNM